MLLRKIVLFILFSISLFSLEYSKSYMLYKAWEKCCTTISYIFYSDHSGALNSRRYSFDYYMDLWMFQDYPQPTVRCGSTYHDVIFENLYRVDGDCGGGEPCYSTNYAQFYTIKCSDNPEDCKSFGNEHYDQKEERCICNDGHYFDDDNKTCIAPTCPSTYTDDNGITIPLVAQNMSYSDCVALVSSNASRDSLIYNISISGITDIDLPNYYCCYGLVCDYGESWNKELHKCIPKCPTGQVYDVNLSICVDSNSSNDNNSSNDDNGDMDGGGGDGDNNITKGGSGDNNSSSNSSNTVDGSNSANNNSNGNSNGISSSSNDNIDDNSTSLNIAIDRSLDEGIDRVLSSLKEQKDLLKDINSSLNPDLTNNEELKDLNGGLEAVKEAYSNIFDSFEQSKNDFLSVIGSKPVPKVTINGNSDCKFCFYIFGSNEICIDLSIFSQFRPFLQFVLNLFLLYLMIKIYMTIARDITKYFLGGS